MILQVSEEQRMLMLTVQKSMLWPEDESLLPKVDIDKLPPWRSKRLLKRYMNRMSIHAIVNALSKERRLKLGRGLHQRSLLRQPCMMH